MVHSRDSIIITGASGFIGRRLHDVLVDRGRRVLALTRQSRPSVGEINGSTDWSSVLSAGSTVVHLAARAHVLDKAGAQDWQAFYEVNVAGTRRLASAAAVAGVRRLVFLSSIGVLGASTTGRSAFSVNDTPAPCDFYGRSKREAELVLREVATETGLDVVVIRPPLVYGPHATERAVAAWLRCGSV